MRSDDQSWESCDAFPSINNDHSLSSLLPRQIALHDNLASTLAVVDTNDIGRPFIPCYIRHDEWGGHPSTLNTASITRNPPTVPLSSARGTEYSACKQKYRWVSCTAHQRSAFLERTFNYLNGPKYLDIHMDDKQSTTQSNRQTMSLTLPCVPRELGPLTCIEMLTPLQHSDPSILDRSDLP
ncbi:hypothetical protein BJY04DRAFT_105783 [Aspergillus karnatakaensis]|uniref:uncharacterized protein n=1 Tax=Aspergillus karnatakaensis TaxID=1810916 RepID=UPI003CCC984C